MNDLAKILGIDEAKVNIKSRNDHAISFYVQTNIKPHSCPNCNALTSKVHDYRIQKMKDIPLQGKSCFLFLKKRRYHCSHCGKRIQKRMLPSLRKYYKRSKSLITKRKAKLSNDNRAELELMLEYSEDLRKAHFIKELFVDILDENAYSKQRTLFSEWLREVENLGIEEFKATTTAFRNNYKYILNSLKYRHISNGPTEGFNNKIKVLKRISYGVRNFKYFRNRILMAMA